jgi:hypothetical protein
MKLILSMSQNQQGKNASDKAKNKQETDCKSHQAL